MALARAIQAGALPNLEHLVSHTREPSIEPYPYLYLYTREHRTTEP